MLRTSGALGCDGLNDSMISVHEDIMMSETHLHLTSGCNVDTNTLA